MARSLKDVKASLVRDRDSSSQVELEIGPSFLTGTSFMKFVEMDNSEPLESISHK